MATIVEMKAQAGYTTNRLSFPSMQAGYLTIESDILYTHGRACAHHQCGSCRRQITPMLFSAALAMQVGGSGAAIRRDDLSE
jgi:hypothetical protein